MLIMCIHILIIHERRLVDGESLGRRLKERAPGLPDRHNHSLYAGAIGGYLVWGRYSGVNYQILLYLASRVLVGIAKKVQERLGGNAQLRGKNEGSNYPLFSALVWGVVMLLFEESPQVLHPSLKKSMDEIYRFDLREGMETLLQE